MIINFWQNIPSPHQSASLRALADAGHTVSLIAEQEILSERKVMGWGPPEFGRCHVVIAPDEEEIARLLTRTAGAVNIVSGSRCAPLCATVLRKCFVEKKPVGLLVEAGDPRGVKGLLRRCYYAREALAWREHTDFLLAIGQTGVNWYVSSGYPKAKVFPYAYVVEAPSWQAPAQRRSEVVQLAFVGSLIELKGTDVLIRALARLAHLRWELHIIGEGPERQYLERLITRVGIRSRVLFHGILPMPQVVKQVAGCDLLVLPSHYDGWGAVVNEALMVGVPVICSNQCGAADLLRSSLLGTIFKAGSLVELTNALEKRITAGQLPAEPRHIIRAMAARVNGQQVADYLLTILAHIYQGAPRPTPPWHSYQDEG